MGETFAAVMLLVLTIGLAAPLFPLARRLPLLRPDLCLGRIQRGPHLRPDHALDTATLCPAAAVQPAVSRLPHQARAICSCGNAAGSCRR